MRILIAAAALSMFQTACARPAATPPTVEAAGAAVPVLTTAAAAPAPPAAVAKPAAAAASPSLLRVLVHKSPTCGCCNEWVTHLRESGFEVDVNETEDLNPIKTRLGVPANKASCHTAEVGGYFVEGHVPAEDIHRLLAERPKARGLAVPGMPIGSPGMGPIGSGPPYVVELVAKDGASTHYATH